MVKRRRNIRGVAGFVGFPQHFGSHFVGGSGDLLTRMQINLRSGQPPEATQRLSATTVVETQQLGMPCRTRRFRRLGLIGGDCFRAGEDDLRLPCTVGHDGRTVASFLGRRSFRSQASSPRWAVNAAIQPPSGLSAIDKPGPASNANDPEKPHLACKARNRCSRESRRCRRQGR